MSNVCEDIWEIPVWTMVAPIFLGENWLFREMSDCYE